MSSRAPVRISGPLAEFAPGFGEHLQRRGYRPGAVNAQLWLLMDVSRWLAEGRLAAVDLTAVRVEQFSKRRRAMGRAHLFSPRALDPLLEYLRGLGVVPAGVKVMPVTPVDVLVERYRVFLLERFQRA